MRSGQESAKIIRERLKAKGWGPKRVSVTSDYTSVNIKIKDITIPLEAVRELSKGEESISRCEASGEILLGGNRYVFVDYHWETVNSAAGELIPAIAKLAPGEWTVIKGFQIAREKVSPGMRFELIDTVAGRGFPPCYNAGEVAHFVTINAAAVGRWVEPAPAPAA